MADNQKNSIIRFLTTPTFFLLFFFIALNIFFALATDRFFRLSNYSNMLKQSTMIMIVGCGATFLMMTESLDLSVGSNLALTNVIYTFLAVFGIPFLGIGPVPLLLSGIVVILIGALIGATNGILVTKFKFESFIATLALFYVCRGLALAAVDGQSIRTGLPDGFDTLGSDSFLGIPLLFLILFLCVTVFLILERKTLLGKYAAAIGGNRNAAFFSGLNVDGVIMKFYIVTGILAAFSGILTASRFNFGDPRTGTGFEFNVLVAILLGGTPLSGGRGTIIGTMIGALIITVLGNGLNAMDIVQFWQTVLKGVILICAIIFHSQLRIRRHTRMLAAGTRA